MVPIKDQQGSVIGLSTIARDVSGRKRAQDVLEERARQAALAASITVILTRRGDLRAGLQQSTESIARQLDAASVRVWTLDAPGSVLELQASAGMCTHVDGSHARVSVGQSNIGRIAKERAPHLTNAVREDPRVDAPDQEWAQREEMEAFAGYPLIVEDRILGVMAIYSRHRLESATLDALATLADQIAAEIERKRAEERLQFTQFTIDHVATPVFWADADGRFFNINDAACKLTGYSRDELLTLSVMDVDDRITSENWRELWNSIRERGTFAMESMLRCKDGAQVAISVNCNLLKYEGREFSCTFLQDISEQQIAEQARRENERRFRAIFKQLQLQIERMPLAYILFDADFRIVDWNPAAETIFGYGKEEMLGLAPPFEKIVPIEFWQNEKELFLRLGAGDMSAHSVNDNLTKDGRRITCEWINTPLKSEDGQFTGLMCLAQDITQRKCLEEQYRQAQKMEAVGSLAGGIAHEFNNLLQAISGYTKFAIEGLANEDSRFQDLQFVLKAADRAAVLTRQLLSFGRRQVLQRSRVDPNQVVTELVKMLRPLIGEHIDLQTHLAPAVAPIYVDPGLMQQVLLNLCINARDAMPGGGRLILRTQNISLSEEYCKDHRGAKTGLHVLSGRLRHLRQSGMIRRTRFSPLTAEQPG